MAIPHNSLKDVRLMVSQGKFIIKGNALSGAFNGFNWGPKEICECLNLLRPSHCYKTEAHRYNPTWHVDFFRAENLKDGEDVYTHFYVKDERVIINSFKPLT